MLKLFRRALKKKEENKMIAKIRRFLWMTSSRCWLKLSSRKSCLNVIADENRFGLLLLLLFLLWQPMRIVEFAVVQVVGRGRLS